MPPAGRMTRTSLLVSALAKTFAAHSSRINTTTPKMRVGMTYLNCCSNFWVAPERREASDSAFRPPAA